MVTGPMKGLIMDQTAAPRTPPVAATTVRDVMTAQPLTIAPTAGFREAVRLLSQAGVDALPVVDDERLVGLVSTEDLLLKEEMVELPHGGSGLPWQRHRDRVRARGRQVAEVMDTQPPTVRPDTTLGRAARELHRRHRGCLLVVDENRTLLGVVTRTDLLSVYLREDPELERDVAALLPDTGRDLHGSVHDGCVRLEGRLHYQSQAEQLSHDVAHIPGVVAVDCRISVEVDDLHLTTMGC